MTGLRLNGRALCVPPDAPTLVFADHATVDRCGEVQVTPEPDGQVSILFVEAQVQFCIPDLPNPKLETRPKGAIGTWERFTLSADGKSFGRRGVTITIDGVIAPPVVALPKLTRRGRDLVALVDGTRHMIVGSTELMLGWRYDREGADAIRPVLAQRRDLRFNNLRFLWQSAPGLHLLPGFSPTDAWLMPLEKARPFHALLAEYGFYGQGAILADAQVVNPNERDQQRRVDEVRAATTGISNLIEQLGNEAEKNGFNPRAFSKPGDRLAANASSTEGGKDYPYWDFFCFSARRDPTQAAIREYGPIEFIYGPDNTGWGGVPAMADEGFKPGKQSSDPRDFERAGAQARSGCGGRFHSIEGSENSRLFNDTTTDCARAFVRGLIGS